jgi:transposase
LDKKDMNSKEIFSLALNIEKPWCIKDIILEKFNANIVFDKFHVNESFYKVWQLERRENKMLKGHKYTFLKDYRNLTNDKKSQLNMLTLMYPKLGEAYRLKVMFDEFWQIKDMQEAQGYFAF